MKQKKTIFIIADQDFPIRNLIYSDIFKQLKNAGGLRIVVLTHKGTIHDYLKANFGGEDVVFERINIEAVKRNMQSVWNRWAARIYSYIFDAKYNLYTSHIQYRAEKIMRNEKNLSFLKKLAYKIFMDFPVFLLRRSKKMRRIFRAVSDLFYYTDAHGELYRRYNPDLVVINSLGFKFHTIFMREAKKHGARILSILLNWDNATSTGVRTGEPDHVVVWNEGMKNEVVQYHDLPPEKIYVGGVAHYDMYYRPETFLPKEDVFKKWGLHPDKKVLFYGTMSPTRFPHNPDVVETLAKACADNIFVYPCQLLVRLHPIYYFKLQKKGDGRFIEEYERFMSIREKYGTVVYNFPDFIHTNSGGNGLLSPDDMGDLVNIINCSSVLLCYFSTLMLEGAILDVPIISLCFDGMSFHYGHGKESVLRLTHLQDVIKSGGVKIAFNEKEMIDAVNSYLKDPGLDAEGRKKMREMKCGPFPGNAGVRIADYIEKVVHEN